MTIPAELQSYPQWVFWRHDPIKGKVPYSWHTDQPCDITDRAAYASFEQISNGKLANYDGRGFCLTREDPFNVYDLDNPYKDLEPAHAERVANDFTKIIGYINSFTEQSPSRTGAHIWTKAKLPEEWRKRRGKIECYTHDRFMTVTGLHWAGTPTTIEHRQNEVEDVARSIELDKTVDAVNLLSRPEFRSDEATLEAIRNASNAEKFNVLYSDPTSGVPSPSEGDQALANFICFHTDNAEQAARIFRASPRYAGRPKLHTRDDLIARVIRNGFDQKPPPIDTTALRKTADALSEIAAAEVGDAPQVSFPPGLIGFIADYIYQSAPRPIREYALAGAIGILAGIVGRCYNINGTGLNHYVVALGPTSIGKEAIGSGISRLIREVRETCDSAQQFLGPSFISSQPALIKSLSPEANGSPSYCSIMGEFGQQLLRMTNPRASDTHRSLYQELLNLYNKSGYGSETGGMRYSQSDDNIKTVQSPAFSFIGDTTDDVFYSACTLENIRSGFIPRLNMFDYKGLKPALNKLAHLFKSDQEQVRFLAQLASYCHMQNQKNAVVQVQLTQDAQEMLDLYEERSLTMYNNDMRSAAAAIWGRVHLKAIKLAALVAVGINPHVPMIDVHCAAWAIDLVNRDAKALIDVLSKGEVSGVNVGEEDPRQKLIAERFLAHVTKPFAKLNKQHAAETNEDMHDKFRVMKLSRLRNKCLFNKPFVTSNYKEREFDTALKGMSEILRVASPSEILKEDASAGHRWGINDPSVQLVTCIDLPALMRLVDSSADVAS